ncbi:stage II sporulation protein M [Clostridium amazonitimonense]|uniref:stage II sporulation protein M n=1 Tax=Clostridium amazonitimonense TaxID=1499689 RepID=UPI00069148E7|nr:stage II sporulation protein M [Clostridium amazonitimonense]
MIRDNKYINNITMHIQENFWLYIISLLFLCTGVVLGVYAVKYMSEVDKLDLANYFNSFTNILASEELNNKVIFFEAIKTNIPIILVLFILGLTLVGMPIILLINLIKGFSIGFTFSFIISTLGKKGVAITLVGMLPQNIIYIPCIVIASVISMRISLDKIRNNVFNQKAHVAKENKNIVMDLVVIAMFVLLGTLIESYITPAILKYFLS